VLALIAGGKTDAAYHDDVYVDERTIDSHIKRVRRKFTAVDDAFNMIDTLYGVGYRFREVWRGGGAGAGVHMATALAFLHEKLGVTSPF
jgi:hypothetical protein